MAIAPLETKLYAPPPRRGVVPRPRLNERLLRGVESKLTLVSAPAGFGKTTLLADHVAAAASSRSSTAWLSLDDGDDQPASFWTSLIAALQTIVPGAGTAALSILESLQPPIEAVLISLLNELRAVPHDLVLVLDDYHSVETPELHEGMAFLIEHLPPQVHVVIATRADPPLPLARLRARGDLVEIRAADLRFTAEETAAYLAEVVGLPLTASDVEALERRTEGWIAALQLAGLSMQERDDVAGFIAGFTGDDRYIVDYLVEEVLNRLPDPVRRFLLETSILRRMTGPLCDVVTGQDGGKMTLEALDRRNLFLVPLDERREWFRYHHLFADVLRARLKDEQPEDVPKLHRRASDWYERHGDRAQGIHHALLCNDISRAADLVELAMPAMRQGRQEAALRHWLEALPDGLLRDRPVLSNGYAGSLLVRGEIDGVEERLRDAERWIDATGSPDAARAARSAGMVVVDEDAFRALPTGIAVHRAGQALILGDVASTMAHARRALEVVGEDDRFGRGAAAALMGLAYWTNGDLELAAHWYADGMTSLVKAAHLSDAIGCALALADIRLAQGRLTEGMNVHERGLRLAVTPDGSTRRGAADMHVGISDILRERDELTAAREHLRKAADLGEENGLPQNRYRSRVVGARIRQAEGDLDGAIDLLAEAERLYVGDFSPNVRPVAALKARVLVAAGRLPEALVWAREAGLSTADDVSYVREFEHVTLTRVLLADATRRGGADAIRDVVTFLAQLHEAAERGGRTASVIDILVVQALAHDAAHDRASALTALEHAIVLAETEGYLRVVVDDGPSIARLLKLLVKRDGPARQHARRLLDAVESAPGGASPPQGLVDPLSERELEVLRLLGTDLSGPDIAGELIVSLNTVRTHTKSIYAKLGVNSRRAAVRRAAELDLLPRAPVRARALTE